MQTTHAHYLHIVQVVFSRGWWMFRSVRKLLGVKCLQTLIEDILMTFKWLLPIFDFKKKLANYLSLVLDNRSLHCKVRFSFSPWRRESVTLSDSLVIPAGNSTLISTLTWGDWPYKLWHTCCNTLVSICLDCNLAFPDA